MPSRNPSSRSGLSQPTVHEHCCAYLVANPPAGDTNASRHSQTCFCDGNIVVRSLEGHVSDIPGIGSQNFTHSVGDIELCDGDLDASSCSELQGGQSATGTTSLG